MSADSKEGEKKEKIELFFPTPFHATTVVGQNQATIIPRGAVPQKSRASCTLSLTDVLVTNEQGEESRYQVILNRKTGDLRAVRCHDDGTIDEDATVPTAAPAATPAADKPADKAKKTDEKNGAKEKATAESEAK